MVSEKKQDHCLFFELRENQFDVRCPIFDYLPVGIFVADQEKFIFVNQTFREMTEVSFEQATQISFMKEFLGSEELLLSQYLEKLFLGEMEEFTYHFQAFPERKTSHVFYRLVCRSAILQNQRFAVGFIEDHTHRSFMEQELQNLSDFPELNPYPVLEADFSGQILYSNPSARKNLSHLKNLKESQPVWNHLQNLMNQEISSGVFMVQWNEKVYELLVRVVKNREVFHLYWVDATEKARWEEELRLIYQVFEHTTEGIVVTDAQGNIVAVNPAFSVITGYAASEVMGRNPRVLKSDRHDEAFYKNMWEMILQKGFWQGEIWNRRKSGEAFLEWLTINTVKDEKGEIVRFISIFSDITHQKRFEKKFEYLLYYDALTGLYNRLMLQEQLLSWISKDEQDKNLLALLFIDLDRFKNINKSLGYLAGDLLLMETAKRLQKLLGESGLVARIGSDDFVVVLPHAENVPKTVLMAQDILNLFSRPFSLKKEEIFVSASIGVSFLSMDAGDMKALLQNAEAAMHRAKENGGNQYQLYHEEMNLQAFEDLILENNLRKALVQDELLMYYQPQIELRTGKLAGAEALVRWRKPGMGLIPPDRFIPLAEETGLILPIGQWVLEESCRQIKQWMDKGYELIPIAVNLSGKQFAQPGILEMIRRILDTIALHPAYLTLEITESITIKNEEEAFRILNQLKSMGLDIAIDDFGTGYSSFAYLKKFPADKVKIDRSFIKEIHNNPQDAAIVQAIIQLAHHLGFLVVAEGAEEEEQIQILNRIGCDYVQGFYYSRPLPAKDFEEHFLKNAREDAELLDEIE